MKQDSTRYNAQLPPVDMVYAPRANQIPFLDRLYHVEDPDIEGFVDGFFIEQGVIDCDQI